MFQTFISRHNSNFFSDKLVLTSVTPASSAPVLQPTAGAAQNAASVDVRGVLDNRRAPVRRMRRAAVDRTRAHAERVVVPVPGGLHGPIEELLHRPRTTLHPWHLGGGAEILRG